MIRFFATLMLILIGLKVGHFTDLHWFWVLFPISIPAAGAAIMLLFAAGCDAWRWSAKKWKARKR